MARVGAKCPIAGCRARVPSTNSHAHRHAPHHIILAHSLIMPNPALPPLPPLTIHIQILHATPHARLQQLRIPRKHPHDAPPAQARKHGPRVLPHPPPPHLRPLHITAAHPLYPPAHTAPQPNALVSSLKALRPWLRGEDGELGGREHDACEDVDDDLLLHSRGGGASEDEIAGNSAREKGGI